VSALLVQPPVCDPHAPLLALPALSAALEQSGRPVRCVDLNLALHEALATEAGLDLLRRDDLPGSAGASRLSLPDLHVRIAAAHGALRDPALYRLGDDGRLRLTDRLAGWHSVAALLAFEMAPFSAARAKAVLARRAPLPFLSWLEQVAVPELLAAAPAWVGLSVTFEQQLLPALVLAGLLREHGLPVFAGGFHLSTVGPDGLRADPDLFDLLDGVVVGEGELAAVALDEALADGRDPADVAGVVTATSGDLAPRPGLADLGCPDLAALPLDRYLAPAPVLPYQASRGCWFGRCAFCNFASVSPGYRRRPADLVLDDLEALAPLAAAFAFAMESEPPRACRELAAGLVDRGIDRPWEIMARLDRGLDAATLRLMADAGCRTIFFGVEAGSARINALMRKEVSGAAAWQVLDGCADAGINVVLSAIAGFPGETRDEAGLTGTFLDRARRRFGDRIVVDGAVHRFRLTRGSPVWEEADDFGLAPRPLDEVGPLAVSVPFRLVAPPSPEVGGRERDPLVDADRPTSAPPTPRRAAPPRRPRPIGHDLLRLLLEIGHPEGFRHELLAERPQAPPSPRPQRFTVDPGATFDPTPDKPFLFCLHPAFHPEGVAIPLWMEPALDLCRVPGGASLDDLLELVETLRPDGSPGAPAWLGRFLPALWSAGILDGA